MPVSSGPIGPVRKSCSPPTLAAPNPAPWNDSQNDTVLKRPVDARASLSATSTASDPPVVISTFERPPGASAPSRSANSTLTSLVNRRGTNGSSRSCAVRASTSRGCPYPSWCAELPWKSRYRSPPLPYRYTPSAPAMLVRHGVETAWCR